MFGLRSWRVGTIFGIPLEVNPTWVLVFGLVAVTLSLSYFPSIEEAAVLPLAVHVAMGVVTALAFFASIVAHEMSHSLVARAGGLKIAKVTLFIFGGVAEMTEEPRRPGHEFLLALAGPAASLLLSLGFGLAYAAAAVLGAPVWLWAPLQYLGLINTSVAVFNMLPGFPLDGGRVLRALLWAVTGDLLKATRWASRAGQALGGLLMATAVAGVLLGTLDLIWLGLLGWFLAGLAGSAFRQQEARSALSGVRVRDVMTPGPSVVDGAISLETLAHEHLLGGRHSRYPVVEDGRVVGLISLARVKQVPREQWQAVSVSQVAERDLSLLVLDEDAPVTLAADRLGPEAPGALLAVRERMVTGILTREDIHRAIRIGS